jgi:hypothetical protein
MLSMTDQSPTPAGHSLGLLLVVAFSLLMALLAECFLRDEANAGVVPISNPPLTERQQSLIKLLGPDVVGEPTAAAPINHVRTWCPLQAESVLFHTPGQEGVEHEVSFGWVNRCPGTPLGSDTGAWTLNSTNRDIKYITHQEGELLLPTEADLHQGVVTVFDPPEALLLANVPVGEPRTMSMNVSVYDLHAPGTLKYSGSLKSTYLDLGGYMVHVPQGTFDARLISVSNVGKVGPADINTEYLAFYAEGVGRIAYINRKHVSAFLFYNTTTQRGMVLSSSHTVAQKSEPAPTAPAKQKPVDP